MHHPDTRKHDGRSPEACTEIDHEQSLAGRLAGPQEKQGPSDGGIAGARDSNVEGGPDCWSLDAYLQGGVRRCKLALCGIANLERFARRRLDQLVPLAGAQQLVLLHVLGKQRELVGKHIIVLREVRHAV